MIELLLEADRALANGALDQAERLYWQSIERDARNAIAVMGLAEIAFRRGDLDTARLFSLKALAIDPDNPAARQMREAVERDGVSLRNDPALPLQAVQQLEALGRRRMSLEDQSGPTVEVGLPPPAEGSAEVPAAAADDRESESTPAAEPENQQPAAEGSPGFTSAADFAAAEAAATLEAIDALDDSVELKIARPRTHGRPHAIRMPRLPSIDHLEPRTPGETPHVPPPPLPAVPPPATPQPPATAQPRSPSFRSLVPPPYPGPTPPLVAPDAQAPRHGDEPTEEEAEAAAFAEAMALLRQSPTSELPLSGPRPEPSMDLEPMPAPELEPFEMDSEPQPEPVEPVIDRAQPPVELDEPRVIEPEPSVDLDEPVFESAAQLPERVGEPAVEPAAELAEPVGEPAVEPAPVVPEPVTPEPFAPEPALVAPQPEQTDETPRRSWETGVDPAEIRKAARPDQSGRRQDQTPQPQQEPRAGLLHRVLRRR